MSWVEAARSIGGGARRWRVIRSVSCALFAGASLAACGADAGFRPMYGTSSLGGSNVNEKLAKIEIAPVPGRVGQRIRNELIFTTTGGGAPLRLAAMSPQAVFERLAQASLRASRAARRPMLFEAEATPASSALIADAAVVTIWRVRWCRPATSAKYEFSRCRRLFALPT